MTTHAHLRRILSRSTEIIADEVLNCASLRATYLAIGDLHPALCREAHVQSLLFAGLRSSGYLTFAEANYFAPASNSRQIDLAVWLPDVRRWLYLELEPCGPHFGYLPVLADAQKLIDDKPTDDRDQLRGLFVYGFRHPIKERDGFPKKYQEMSGELQQRGFTEVGIIHRPLEGVEYPYVQAGLWVLGIAVEREANTQSGSTEQPYPLTAIRNLASDMGVSDLAARHDSSDPVIEAYKKDVDRALLRENLKLTPEERFRKFER